MYVELCYDIIVHMKGGIAMKSESFKWFVSHYQELFEKYGCCYLIIYDKNVTGTAESPKDALKKAAELHPDGDYIIQFCDGNTTAYTNFISSWQLAVI